METKCYYTTALLLHSWLFELVSNCFIQVCNPIDINIFTIQLLNYVFNIIRIALYIQLSRNCLYLQFKKELLMYSIKKELLDTS